MYTIEIAVVRLMRSKGIRMCTLVRIASVDQMCTLLHRLITSAGNALTGLVLPVSLVSPSGVPFWCPLLVSLVSLVSWISSLVTPLLLLLFLLLLLILPLSFSPSWCRQLKPAPLVLLLLFRTAAQRTHVIIWWSGQDHLLHEPKEVSDRPKTDSCLCCDPSCPLLRIMWMQWMQWPQWLQWIHQIWKLGDWGIGK